MTESDEISRLAMSGALPRHEVGGQAEAIAVSAAEAGDELSLWRRELGDRAGGDVREQEGVARPQRQAGVLADLGDDRLLMGWYFGTAPGPSPRTMASAMSRATMLMNHLLGDQGRESPGGPGEATDRRRAVGLGKERQPRRPRVGQVYRRRV
jgi:hypothetical protein